ncbi:Ger(x)C family spore germination protein [Bacillus thuringiensis]|uniref:Ger(x)C family spore germination protein n=1 Tax=Bacillus thuringiensis TaxID=1428 RepID=UPI002E184F52|nr:Ger(x)C family spore germination protein [Bacillus thuringiensis]MEC5308497.1 Ger(x)C family spore germination protein [Bacillus thuringiensis]
MKQTCLCFLILVLIFPMAGCWGIKEMQEQAYVTELGIDYKDGKYVVYFQILNFKSVAKPDVAESGSSSSLVNLGVGKGDTIHEAFGNIEESSQIPLYFGHINTIFLTESILTQHMKETLDFLSRNIFIRYSTWLFAVQGDLEDIILTRSIFDGPPIYTVSFRPQDVLKRNSFISATSLRKLVSRYYEPVGSVMVPSVKINKHSWRDYKGNKKLLSITGAYFFSNQKLGGWLKENDLKGWDWFNGNAKIMYLNIKKKKISVQIKNPHAKIQVLKQNSPKFDIVVKAHAVLDENSNQLPLNVVNQALQQQIKSDIRKSFQKGLIINTDILNLYEKAYRFHYTNWRILDLNNLKKNAIADIQVKIHIENSGDYKS